MANLRGYTKHYYAGSERVCSKLGGGGIPDINAPPFDAGYKQRFSEEAYRRLWDDCAGMAAPCSTYLYYSIGDYRQAVVTPETDLYFHHPDHLGSSSWITDARGAAIQHLQYLPFGETRIDQRATGWSSRYTFSGKEKDEETEYSYFGARYYNSHLSVWLSVDPLLSKYPSLSPYVYCANNPIKLVDPDGRDIWEADAKGRLTMIEERDGNDVIRSAKTGAEKELSGKGVLAATYSDKKDANGNVTETTFNGMSRSDARATFSFLGDNSDVEWGFMETKDGGNSNFVVGSAHNGDGETLIFNQAMAATPSSVVRYDHSHLSDGDPTWGGHPSTTGTSANPNLYSDVGAWKDLLKVHPKASLGIHFKSRTEVWIRGGAPVEGFTNTFYKSN